MTKSKKEIENAIKSYNGNAVSTLDPLVHIRQKPTMYLGSVAGNPNHLFEEALMNSLDEYADGVADHITVHLYRDGSLAVGDNGRGMPPEYEEKFKMPVMRALLTKVNTGKAFNSTMPGTSQNGVGMKAALATSDWLQVKTWRNGYEYFDEYETIDEKPGIPKVKLIKDKNGDPQLPKKKCKKDLHGTTIRFKPSANIWGDPDFKYAAIKTLCHELAYLHSNLTIELINDITSEHEVLHEAGGTKQYLQDLVKENDSKLITPIFQFNGNYESSDKAGKHKFLISADITLAWTNSSNTKDVLFTNNVPNPAGGTPISGLHAGLTRLINKYNKDLDIVKSSLEQRDVLPGLMAIVVMTHPNPEFDGQTKKEITSADAKNALNTITFNSAQLAFDRSVDQIKQVIKLAYERLKERQRAANETFNLKDKNITKNVSKKLRQCRKLGADAELFIVEGDSAAGPLVSQRDPNYQAIMPLRGKIINTYKNTLAKSMSNMEIATIFAAIGTGVNKDFDISKLNYGKIIIATDADPDGAHISDLILTAFMTFTPDLIRTGHVYRALSPLYVNTLKNKKIKYTYTEDEQTAWKKTKEGKMLVSAARKKGLGELTKPQVSETLMEPGTRILVNFKLDDDNEAASENMLDVFMGKNAAERKDIFYNEGNTVEADV